MKRALIVLLLFLTTLVLVSLLLRLGPVVLAPGRIERPVEEARPPENITPEAAREAVAIAEQLAVPLFRKVRLFEAGHVYALKAADYDGDGDPDLALANYGGQNYLLINEGNGSFRLSPQFGSGSAIALAWSDLDGDGHPDLVVANFKGASAIWWNNGDGSFSPTFTFEHQAVKALAVADFDRDGFDDLAVGTDAKGNYLYLNNRDRSFSGKPLYGSWFHTTVLLACELVENAATTPDLIVGTDFQQNQLFVNQGEGVFLVQPNFGENYHTLSAVCADFDQDGDLDVAVGNNFQASNRDRNFLYLNEGNGSFRALREFGAGIAEGMTVADLDGNGFVDLAVGNYNSQVVLWLNRGGLLFEPVELPNSKGYLKDLIAVDLDGDGALDLVAAYDKQGVFAYLSG